MDLILSEHQSLIQQSIARLCATHARHSRSADDISFTRLWRSLAEGGWISTLVPSEHGGMGLGAVELAIIARELGKAALIQPLASVATAVTALAQAAAPSPWDAVIEAVGSGDYILVPSILGAAPPFGTAGPLPIAHSAGRVVILHGQHRFVPDAQKVDRFLVAAHHQNRGPILILLNSDQPGLTLATSQMADGSTLSDLNFDGPSLPAEAIVAEAALANRLRDFIHHRILIAKSAELAGLARTALSMTIEFTKVRHQFGRSIASNQAIQHRLVDCFVSIELLDALLFQVARDSDLEIVHPASIIALKSKAGKTAIETFRAALQLHGAMAYTDEHPIGQLYKRALTLDAEFGNEASMASRFFELAHPHTKPSSEIPAHVIR